MDDLERRFRYHAPDEHTRMRHETVREAMLGVARMLDGMIVTDCREKSLMLTHLEEVSFWAHAAIARHGHPELEGEAPVP